MTRCRPNGT